MMKTHIASVSLLLICWLAPAAGEEEQRYVGMLDEPCSVESDLYGELKFCYVPFKVVISAGDSIIWENVGEQVHTVTSGTLVQRANHFNSGLVAPASTYVLTFAVEGIYPYYCMMHPWMNGSIVVGEKVDVADFVVILEDGQFQNSTGVYWANGTAVVPEFPFAIIILVVTVTMVIVFSRQKVLTY